MTLEVSKLIGWLKAVAYCRVEGEGMQCGRERCEPGGGRARGVVAAHERYTRGMHEEGPNQCLGLRARAERTKNILNMVVTLEVLKLSGWLNADASCRVERRACDAGGERGGSREAGGPVVWWRHTGGMHGDGLTQGSGAKGTRGAHEEHVAHGRDAGRVEAQRLVEGIRVLPSRREGMRCGGERCGLGSGMAWCGGGTQEACMKKARLNAWGQGHARSAP